MDDERRILRSLVASGDWQTLQSLNLRPQHVKYSRKLSERGLLEANYSGTPYRFRITEYGEAVTNTATRFRPEGPVRVNANVEISRKGITAVFDEGYIETSASEQCVHRPF